MNELAAVGVLEIAIGGGEPLCHPDILSLLDQARAIGLDLPPENRTTLNARLLQNKNMRKQL